MTPWTTQTFSQPISIWFYKLYLTQHRPQNRKKEIWKIGLPFSIIVFIGTWIYFISKRVSFISFLFSWSWRPIVQSVHYDSVLLQHLKSLTHRTEALVYQKNDQTKPAYYHHQQTTPTMPVTCTHSSSYPTNHICNQSRTQDFADVLSYFVFGQGSVHTAFCAYF